MWWFRESEDTEGKKEKEEEKCHAYIVHYKLWFWNMFKTAAMRGCAILRLRIDNWMGEDSYCRGGIVNTGFSRALFVCMFLALGLRMDFTWSACFVQSYWSSLEDEKDVSQSVLNTWFLHYENHWLRDARHVLIKGFQTCKNNLCSMRVNEMKHLV